MTSADKNATDANNNPHILRAKDIIPPYNQNSPNADKSESFNPDSGIPKFDLAEQILAQQRKLSATKRKSPACGESRPGRETTQKIDTSVPQPEPRLTYRSASPPATPSGQQDLIIVRDIVKRDIEKLCRGHRIAY